LLSLESAVRFWPQMGLSGACADLRQASEEHRIKFEQIDANESLGDDQRTDALVNLLRSTLGQVSARCGGEFVDNLVSWAKTIFPTNRQLITQPFLWTQILRNAGRQGPGSLAALDIAPDKKVELLDAIVKEIVNQKDIHQQVKDAEAEPRGAWDAQKFAAYAADIDGASPLDMVKEAVLRYRFARVWGRISSFLAQDDIRELLTWAKAEAARMRIPADLLDIPRYELG